MKKNIKLLPILLLAFVISIPAKAQDEDVDVDTIQFQVLKPREAKKVYFTLGGGFSGTFLTPKYDDLNARLKSIGLDELSGPVFMPGFEIFVAMEPVFKFLHNTKFGFFNQAGNKEISKDISIEGVAYTKALEYSISQQGFTIDYNFELFRGMALSTGLSLGWGNLTLENYQSQKNADWKDFGSIKDTNTYFVKAESSYYLAQPNISIEWAVQPYVMLRLNAGYNFTFGQSDWKQNHTATIANVPSNLKTDGLKIQFGVFIGLFQFFEPQF
jgi:hypothetical protein